MPTSLAIFWGEEARRSAGGGRRGGGNRAAAPPVDDPLRNVPPEKLLEALSAASDKLTADFGTWKTPWGDINRFQRLTGDIVQPFSDSGPSIPVAFPSAQWGSLASFGARAYPGTKKWYGTSGNSFVAVVEFGPKVHALAVTAGGESGHPGVAAFQRRSQALRHRRSARGLLLPGSAQRTHRARIPSRKLRLGYPGGTLRLRYPPNSQFGAPLSQPLPP